MKKFLKTIDYYSRELKLTYKGNQNYKSFLGGFLTIVSMLVILINGWLLGKDIYLRENPLVVSYDEVLPSYPTTQINYNNIFFGFFISDTLNNPFEDESIIQIIPLIYLNYYDKYGNLKYKEKFLELTDCQSEFSRLNITQPLKTEIFSPLRCIKNFNEILTGFWTESYISYLMFKVFKCTNESITENSNLETSEEIKEFTDFFNNLHPQNSLSSSNVSNSNSQKYLKKQCKSAEEIEEIIPTLFFNFFYSRIVVNSKNFTSPMIDKINEDWFILGTSIFKTIDYYFQNIIVRTDDNLIISGEYKDLGKVSYYKHSPDYSSLKPNDSNILWLNIYISNQVKYFTREYIKAQNIFANLGGIIQCIIIVCKLFLNPYLNRKLNVKIINELFDFDDQDFPFRFEKNKIFTVKNNKENGPSKPIISKLKSYSHHMRLEMENKNIIHKNRENFIEKNKIFKNQKVSGMYIVKMHDEDSKSFGDEKVNNSSSMLNIQLKKHDIMSKKYFSGNSVVVNNQDNALNIEGYTQTKQIDSKMNFQNQNEQNVIHNLIDSNNKNSSDRSRLLSIRSKEAPVRISVSRNNFSKLKNNRMNDSYNNIPKNPISEEIFSDIKRLNLKEDIILDSSKVSKIEIANNFIKPHLNEKCFNIKTYTKLNEDHSKNLNQYNKNYFRKFSTEYNAKISNRIGKKYTTFKIIDLSKGKSSSQEDLHMSEINNKLAFSKDKNFKNNQNPRYNSLGKVQSNKTNPHYGTDKPEIIKSIFNQADVNSDRIKKRRNNKNNDSGSLTYKNTIGKQKINQNNTQINQMLNYHPINVENFKLYDLNLQDRNNKKNIYANSLKIKNEKSHPNKSIIMSKIEDLINVNKKKLKFSNSEIFTSYLCCKRCNTRSLRQKRIIYNFGEWHLNKYTDYLSNIKNIQEIKKMKYLLFNTQQIMSFDYLTNPKQYKSGIYNENQAYAKSFTNDGLDKRENILDIYNYFDNKIKCNRMEGIDRKIWDIFDINLKNLLLSNQ